MKKLSRNLVGIAFFTAAITTNISAQDTITVASDQKLIITDAKVNAVIPDSLHYPIYRWWLNDSCMVGTEQELTVPENTLTSGQVYKFLRTTRCSACGQDITSPGVYAKVKPSPVAELVANMILVPGGKTTLNGTPNVQIDTFKIGKYEVTQSQWLAVMNNSWPETEPDDTYGKGDNFPAYYVSWDDIVGTSGGGSTLAYTEKGIPYYTNGFCYKLSHLVDASDKKHFRLPAEAEWEYAAKGGQQTHNYAYSGGAGRDSVAWYNGNSGNKAHEVGAKAANELGIFDMSGNVGEWCNDRWNRTYPSTDNPAGGSSGSSRVWRGGSWGGLTSPCRVSTRGAAAPTDMRTDHIGFRVVLVQE